MFILDSDTIECECGGNVETYDHEIIQDDNGILKIDYKGWCPLCHSEFRWTSTYHFVEMYASKEKRKIKFI